MRDWLDRHPRWRRTLKALGVVVCVPVALILAAVILLSLESTRERLLGEALRRADAALPGRLAVGRTAWPAAGTLELRDLAWTDGGDTLLTVSRLRLALDLGDLRRRDLHLHELRAEIGVADVAGIARRLAPEAGAPVATAPATPTLAGAGKDAGGGVPWLRPGSLPWLPSAAVDELSLAARAIRLEGGAVAAEIAGAAELRADRPPSITIATARARGPDGSWRLDELELAWDDATGRATGHGAGSVGQDWPLTLRLETAAPDSVDLVVRAGEGSPGAVVSLRGRVRRDPDDRDAWRYDLRLSLPGTAVLAGLPALAGPLASLPELEGLDLDLAGRARRGPDPAAELSLAVAPGAWCEGGEAEIAWRDGVLDLARLELALPDLLLRASGRLGPDALDLEADAAVRGTRWLSLLAPAAAAPESLAADLALRLDGTPAAPRARADLSGHVRRGGLVLDRVHVTADVPPDGQGPAVLALEARAFDLVLAAGLALERGDTLFARLDPLVIAAGGEPTPADRDRSAPRGTVTYVPATGALRLERVALRGALGNLDLEGGLDPVRGGAFRLDWRWPRAPEALLAALGTEPAVADSIRAAWRRDGEPRLVCETGIESETGPDGTVRQRRVRAGGTLLLPGPRSLAAILPAAAAVSDLGPLRGRFDAGATLPAAGEAAWRAEIDLSDTGWLDAAGVVAHGLGAAAVLDSLRLSALDLRLVAGGTAGADSVDLAAALELAGTELLRRFAPGLPVDLELGCRVELDVTGPRADPAAGLRLTAHAAAGTLALPRLEGRATWRGGAADVAFEAPEGVILGPDRLDRVDVRAASRGDGGLFPARVALDLAGPSYALSGRLEVARDSLLVVTADSLRLRARSSDLLAARPFTLRMDPAAHRLDVEDLDLAGSMGRITAAGHAGPHDADLAAEFSLRPPRPPALLDVPEGLWPELLEGRLDVAGPDRLELTVRTGGLALGERTGLSLELSASARDSVAGAASLTDAEGRRLLALSFRLPARVRAYPPAASLAEAPLAADLSLDALPVPLLALTGAGATTRLASLDGALALRGTPAAPTATGWLRLGFPGWPKLAPYQVAAIMRLAPAPAGADTIAAPRPAILDDLPALPETDGAGAALALALFREERRLLDGVCAWPLTVSLSPPALRQEPERPLLVRLDSEAVPLAEFDALLPAGVGTEGEARLRLRADGPAADPRLDGALNLPRIRVELADGSRVQLKGDASLAGTGRRPVIRGRVEVEQGVLRVPEPPQNLLPLRGNALLWREAAVDSTSKGRVSGKPVDRATAEDRPEGEVPDAGRQAAGPVEPAGTAEPAGPVAPSAAPSAAPDAPAVDADLELIIPGGLWLRGQGLEIELSGDLDLTYRDRAPVVIGDLRAARGFYVLLGRTFTVERGLVSFYGEEEIDPTLDLSLTTRLDETLFRVQFSGTLLDPRLALSSEPEMAEGDIMAYLLFGRPLDELSGDQIGLVQQRATDLMAAFGTVELEARLSQQLGVDMVQIGRGRGQAEGTSLLIGKYLSRRVLLKYEQALEEWSSFFINLEYFLSRNFKVETLLSQQGQSGLEMNWSREY